MSQHLSKFLCLTVTKKFVGNTCVLCFRKFPVAKKFMDKKGAEYQDFPSKFICVTVPKIFVGEPFNVSLFSVIEKSYASEGYVTFFFRNFFSHSTETFRRGTVLCCISENFW